MLHLSLRQGFEPCGVRYGQVCYLCHRLMFFLFWIWVGLTGATDSFAYNLEGPTKVKPPIKIVYPCDINATA